MGISATVAPLGLGLLAMICFFIAINYRQKEVFSRFEIFFTFGNIFTLAALFTVYISNVEAGFAFADVIFPIFSAVLWIYVLICFIIVFKTLKNFMTALVKYKGKGYLDGV